MKRVLLLLGVSHAAVWLFNTTCGIKTLVHGEKHAFP